MGDEVVLSLGALGRPHIGIERIDAEWQEQVTSQEVRCLNIDLHAVEYIDHEVLLYLTSLIAQRQRNRLSTTIQLPVEDRQLDFLLAWKFDEAVADVCQTSFTELLDGDSQEAYERALPKVSRYIKPVRDPLSGWTQQLPVSFFALTKLAVDDRAPKDIAAAERERWQDQHIVGVLDSLLKNFGNRVASRVVYEAVLNAASHPGAHLAFTSSQLHSDRKKGSRGLRSLTLCTWDDGLSYSDTLGRHLSLGSPITSPSYGLIEEVFEISVLDGQKGQNYTHTISSFDAIDAQITPEILTVAAFLLGVTSSSPIAAHATEGSESQDEKTLIPPGAAQHRGLGLFLIRRAVIDQFGGTIDYISANHRVRLSQSMNVPSHYRVRIKKLGPGDLRVCGNLLVIKIPLGRGSA